MARIIVVTSGKGGVGKTTVVSALGRRLAENGRRVLVADADFGLNNLDLDLGLENAVTYDLFDVLDGRCRIRQALIADPKRPNLTFLPSDKLKTDVYFTAQNVRAALLAVGKLFDYVFVDSPAGIDEGFSRAAQISDEAIVVTTPSLAALRDADKALSLLDGYAFKEIGVVVNRVRGDFMLDKKCLFPNEIGELLKRKVIGVIPEDDAVLLSAGKELPKRSPAAKAVKLLAAAVETGNGRLYDATRAYRGFWGGIKRGLRKSL